MQDKSIFLSQLQSRKARVVSKLEEIRSAQGDDLIGLIEYSGKVTSGGATQQELAELLYGLLLYLAEDRVEISKTGTVLMNNHIATCMAMPRITALEDRVDNFNSGATPRGSCAERILASVSEGTTKRGLTVALAIVAMVHHLRWIIAIALISPHTQAIIVAAKEILD